MQRLRLLALLLPLSLSMPATASGQVEVLYGKSYALVVGVDQYPHPEWPDLPFARKDAQAVARLLEAQGFDEVLPLYDQGATLAAIVSTLEDRIAPRLKPDDRVLVFFSGHGTTKSIGGQDYGYLVPHDGTDESATWLSMTTLREMSRKLGLAKHQLFILDSCFGGSFVTKGGPTTISRTYPDYIREVARRSARQFLTAGGQDQKVRAVGPHGYSFFTGYLLEALGEGLADEDGDDYITALELAQYLQKRAANEDQTPGFGDLPGHGLGAFLFSAPRRPGRTAEVQRPPAGGTVAALALKGGVEIVPIEAERELVTNARLREAPSASAAAVADVARGTKVWIAGRVQEGDWLLVEHEGHRGYVLGRAVAPIAAISDLDPTPSVLSLPPECEGPEQCHEQGDSFFYGRGVSQDYKKAAVSYFRACVRGEPRGCTTLGYLYDTGLGIAQDSRRAHDLYTQGCDGGNARGCTNLGVLYREGLGVAQDYRRAHDLYKQGCDGGDAMGCSNLGYLYGEGLGVAQDYRRAHDLFKQACDGGNADGCTSLGYLYGEGLGVAQDYRRAHDLYTQGCDGGNAVGCTNLGGLYRQGLGVAQDYRRAHDLFKQACDGGNADGCTSLGYLYMSALGVAQDRRRGHDLFQQACDGGSAVGCRNLAVSFELGRGITKNPTRARELYKEACDGGDEKGCAYYERLSRASEP